MKTIFSALLKTLAVEDAVLVTIVAGSGSTPRGAGAAMVVKKEGRVTGTIGGGAVEYKSQQLAIELLLQKSHGQKEFLLTPNQVEDLGMVCGGDVRVYFRFFSKDNISEKLFIETVLQRFHKDEDSWFLMDLPHNLLGLYSVSEGFQGFTIPEEQLKDLLRFKAVEKSGIYAHPLKSSGKVVVFGGGHVAQELIPILTQVHFTCYVYDDRPDFVTESLFPQAAARILGSFEQIDQYVDLQECDYAVVMTRGHSYDYIVQKQLHRRPLAYLGIIGSRKKMATVFERLREDGISQDQLATVYTPIGLPIKAETPAEIAVSIAAEMIRVRAERKERS